METKKVITVFALAMINVSLIASLRGLPMMAEYGLGIVFMLLLAVLVFLIPSALVSAELATGWPDGRGIYTWVREAFGEKMGFTAIWLQWSQNLVFYPTALAALAAALAFAFMPELAESKIFTLIVILVVYWGATLFNFRGIKDSAALSKYGAMFGIILPAIALVLVTAFWVISGNPSQIAFNVSGLIPDMSNIGNIVFFAGIILYFAGIEVSAVHAKEVENPQKNFPKAIFLSAAIIIGIFVLGALSIAMIVPQSQISLTAGLMETLEIILDKFNVHWLVPVIALLVAPGLIAQVSSWIAGPSRGILQAAKEGNLPPFFQKVNKNGVQTNILIFQGIIVSVLSFVFLFMPSVSSGFWILTALTIQLYLLMYILMFAAAIKLKYTRPDVKRFYSVPGGNLGMWCIAGLGLIASLFTIIIGFFPPTQLVVGNMVFFESFLISGMVLMVGAPILINHLRSPKWRLTNAKQKS